MHADFAKVPFADPARASVNLSLIGKLLPARLLAALPTLLAQLPDPDGALNYLERYLHSDDASGVDSAVQYMNRHPAALHYALLIFSHSRYLSETLVQQPDLIPWLHRPAKSRQFRRGIEHVKSQEDLEEDFARFETSAIDLEPPVLLTRFKRREYLRITTRDLLGLASLSETILELSELADLLLARALRMAEAKLAPLFGTPQCIDEKGRALPAHLTVLSLGKLGARELNYNSDIDLAFLYTGEGETTGGSAGKLANSEYFVRLSHNFLRLISEVTPEGAVFRVDMRLRPRGAEGFLAISIRSALDYYRSAAREWELQMLIKARSSTGDLDAGRRFLRELHPLVFTPKFNVAAVEAVLNAREEMSRSLARRARRTTPSAEAAYAARWNVKLTPGGIRDIEFLTQCLQRLYGGADPWLSAPAASATLVALQRLHDKGHLNGHDFQRLAAAYQFLRRVEHRLQLRDGLQRHTLPNPAASATGALDRLARRCGVEPSAGRSPAEELLHNIAQYFAEVREIYERILLSRRAPEPASAEPVSLAAPANVFTRVREEHPRLGSALEDLLSSDDPFLRRGLNRFLSAALLDSSAIARMQSDLSWIPRAADVFAKSDLAVDMFTRSAADILLLAGDSFRHPAAHLLNESGIAVTVADGMSALRVAYCRATLGVVVAALEGTSPPFTTFATLSRLADQALLGSLRLVWDELATAPGVPKALPRPLPSAVAEAPFAVLALGRLGTHEMDIASDADLVFVVEESLTVEEREPWRRLAERLVTTVSSYTQDGLLFPVDTRLRPRGAEGDLVQSAAYLRDYLRTEAQAWEAATYLKARPVAGNLQLGARVVADVRAALADRWSSPAGLTQLLQQLAEMRLRLEREGTGPRARGEFKHLPGGFYDIEYISTAACFRALASHHDAFPVGANTMVQLEHLASTGALERRHAETLSSSTLLFRSADHAHRLVTGRAANRPPDPALAQRIARLLAQWQLPLPTPSADGLHTALQSARLATRQIYDHFFGVRER